MARGKAGGVIAFACSRFMDRSVGTELVRD